MKNVLFELLCVFDLGCQDVDVILSCISMFSQATYQRMLSMLAQCEFTMEKSVQVHAMNLSEQESYEKLTKDIGKLSTESG